MNAHPEGCRVQVREQVEYVQSQGRIDGPKKVLIIGASGGYGLASRITAAFGTGADTIGLVFEKEPTEKRPGTAGYYTSQEFDKLAKAEGLKSITVNDDAFSHETKQTLISIIQKEFGTLDMVIYSLASGVRKDPETGEVYRSVLKPIGSNFSAKSVDAMKGEITDFSIEPANEKEIADTVKVMGGEDWKLWIDALQAANVLSEGCVTLAYSYIGPEVTHAVYRDGTIGKAKEHLEKTAHELMNTLQEVNGKAYVSVNKALVTRASAVIPVVPLYLSILFQVMKEKGIHEGCIEQIYRLFTEKLHDRKAFETDQKHRIRLDDWEMRKDVQKAVDEIWPTVTTENIYDVTDLKGYQRDFLHLHGFGYDQIDYEADVDIQ